MHYVLYCVIYYINITVIHYELTIINKMSYNCPIENERGVHERNA